MGINLPPRLSRIPADERASKKTSEENKKLYWDGYGGAFATEDFQIAGRIILNIW